MSKKILGIDCAARYSAVGGFIVGAVVINSPSFFRKFARIKFKKNTTKEERAKIVAACKNFMWYDVLKKPATIIQSKDTIKVETEGIIEMLNRVPKFWENHDIHIINSVGTKEQFIEEFENLIPHNLKLIKDKFKYDKWKIVHDAHEKYNIVGLARIIAKWAQDIESSEIEEVWGKFGSGHDYDLDTKRFISDNPDCPYIRPPFIEKKKKPE